jgi:hypothetical protein
VFAKPRSRDDVIVVDDAQCTKPHAIRISKASKGTGVKIIEPTQFGVPSVAPIMDELHFLGYTSWHSGGFSIH